ncbi:heavy metal-associated isoprenylated plant protein 24 [Ipomoea triloba]|uniref:heavy metal-associated isoprenylated plant protein 24 n=1 Tax=Ipomoea triloba TaxID=35885 RepID=UPI00125E3355|nr:heavy metal-associated isoprenylated plant protein 24 [Ipomoea triloba]GMC48431.1 heavy metal-associated isoprenylated plant protein 24-like [Ipomoea batatas]GMC52547.1 heavy metal-associated isoprenylated plant protein 24-like [Ipomoea batatas]GMC54594.1 heavy metal-associated isoprenylated plant protein 24-like [Ipomoea batatas]GMC55222.1 heavy metal-associated isoprenylated plant protein 24-like [Ipomoea batatas]GMC56425.1 heavy metal-associated isoprenylated plant protein 24-like [Ipomo
MGVAGTLEFLSDLLSSAKRSKKKKKQVNTVAIKIRMDCEGCVRKVKKVLSGVKGAKSVDVDLKQQKATVTGFVDAKKVMKAAKSTGKKCEPWPYVPYAMVAHPYVAGVYDKKAPPNFVRATNDPAIANLNPMEEQFTLMFSDENPNACSIM